MYDLNEIRADDTQVIINCNSLNENSINQQKHTEVLVGDNITIQEPPPRTKKVQFLDQRTFNSGIKSPQRGDIPEQKVFVFRDRYPFSMFTGLMDISAGDYPCSLYAVEAGFGASYDKTLLNQTAPIVYPPPETMSWKQRLALKSCFFLLISLPFLMIAIIQPWNDIPAAHSHDIYQQQNETTPIV